MLIFNTLLQQETTASYSVYLPFDKRVRGKLRITLVENGEDAGIDVKRGDVLSDGACIAAEDGSVLAVYAEAESVSVATTTDQQLFARACYHVGNRHAQVQIEKLELIYLHDHVLDEMLAGLGLTVTLETRAFDPENGAYAGNHSHSHSHESDVSKDHVPS